MSKTKNTASKSVSSNNIIIAKDLIFSKIDVQLDNNEIVIIKVVNNTKYIERPSKPRYKS